MRLPLEDPDLAAQVVDTAIAKGINYFETTRGYISGRCQHLVAGGLKGRSRGLIVSGKTGVGEETTADSYRKDMDLQFEILGVDYLEFYQVGWFSWEKMPALTKRGGALEALHKAMAEGIIGHIGFTGHDSPANFQKCIETGIFESFTIPYNMLDRSYTPTIKRAGELGIGVVAMCPVAGGMLAAPSTQLQQLIPGGAATTAAAAVQFVLANPDISVAASGMNTLEQIEENVAIASAFTGMTDDDRAQMERILDDFAAIGSKFCTGCGYCMDCPNGVDIPRNFRLYNTAKVYGLMDWARREYASLEAAKQAGACQECGQCEPKCPNSLPIQEQLAQVASALA